MKKDIVVIASKKILKKDILTQTKIYFGSGWAELSKFRNYHGQYRNSR